MSLTPQLLAKLNDALINRTVSKGFALLDRVSKDLNRLSPSDPNAAGYLLCVAQYVDLGYRDFAYLDTLASRFAEVPRGEMRLSDYLRLRIVEALRAFAADDVQEAVAIFDSVVQVEPGILEPHLTV